MLRFAGRLRHGQEIVLGGVVGVLEADGTGRLVVRRGGLLGGHLPTDRRYSLEGLDERAVPVRVVRVQASDSSGAAVVHFRLHGA